jgi:hypothetical protein
MKPAISVLFAILSFHCAAVPPSQTSEQDPTNPKAPEAPVVLQTKVLAADPPPPAALQDTAASGGSQGDGGSAEGHEHGQMTMPEQGTSKQPTHEGHGGHHDMGSTDAGVGVPQPPHHHAAMDGGAP